MPALLKVNGLNLSTFLRVQPDDGLDVADSEYLTPQFGGAPALAEGGVFVADTARNKQWEVPLWTNSTATGAQGVNDLIEQVNNALDRGPAAVEFRPEGASQSTFFDLEAGRLDPTFSHFHHRKGWAKSNLKLWTKPYGHTATARTVVASTIPSAMLGPGLYNLTGIKGDARPLANIYAEVLGATSFLMYAFSPLPSYKPFIGASNFAFGTMVSATNAIGSSYRKWDALTGTDLAGLFVPIATIALPPQGYAGRNRIYAVAGHQFSGALGSGVQLRLVRPQASAILTTGTALIRSSATSNFCLVDLGEVTVASQVPGAGTVDTAFFTIEYCHAYPTYLATFPLRINGVVVQPLDHAAGLQLAQAFGGVANNFAWRTWPEREVYSNSKGPNAAQGMGPSGLFSSNRQAAFRGDLPRPPGASQMWFTCWAGGFFGNDVLSDPVGTSAWQVDIVERFKFLR